jgi:hypothetical protein
MGWMFIATLRPFYPRERAPLSIVQKAWWASGSVWTDVEKITGPRRGSNSQTPQSLASRNTDYAASDWYLPLPQIVMDGSGECGATD